MLRLLGSLRGLFEEFGIPAAVRTKPVRQPIAIKNGVIICGDEPLTGGRESVQWWRGSVRWPAGSSR